MIKKLLLQIALILSPTLILGPALCFATTSTIDPTVPADHATMTGALFRNQFLAAYNDINSLLGEVEAGSLSPTNFDTMLGASGTGFVFRNSNGSYGLHNAFYSITSSSPLVLTTSGSTISGSILQSSSTQNGYLSNTDWNTFNSKVGTNGATATGTWPISVTGNASTVTTNANLTGDVTSVGNVTSISNSVVTGKTLSGLSIAVGTVSSTDTILTAIGKILGNIGSQTNGGRVISSGSSDTMVSTDNTIAWNSSTASTKSQSILACTSDSSIAWKSIQIKDEIGTSNKYPIVVTPVSGTVEGLSSISISGEKPAVKLQCDGVSNWMMM
jgi:hypothetical protein